MPKVELLQSPNGTLDKKRKRRQKTSWIHLSDRQACKFNFTQKDLEKNVVNAFCTQIHRSDNLLLFQLASSLRGSFVLPKMTQFTTLPSKSVYLLKTGHNENAYWFNRSMINWSGEVKIPIKNKPSIKLPSFLWQLKEAISLPWSFLVLELFLPLSLPLPSLRLP